jgi:hypothetical protein
MERESNTLSELVLTVKRAREERSLNRIHREVITNADVLVVVGIARVGSRTLLSRIIQWKDEIRIIRTLPRIGYWRVELLIQVSEIAYLL